jgi:hypothetical protein
MAKTLAVAVADLDSLPRLRALRVDLGGLNESEADDVPAIVEDACMLIGNLAILANLTNLTALQLFAEGEYVTTIHTMIDHLRPTEATRTLATAGHMSVLAAQRTRSTGRCERVGRDVHLDEASIAHLTGFRLHHRNLAYRLAVVQRLWPTGFPSMLRVIEFAQPHRLRGESGLGVDFFRTLSGDGLASVQEIHIQHTAALLQEPEAMGDVVARIMQLCTALTKLDIIVGIIVANDGELGQLVLPPGVSVVRDRLTEIRVRMERCDDPLGPIRAIVDIVEESRSLRKAALLAGHTDEHDRREIESLVLQHVSRPDATTNATISFDDGAPDCTYQEAVPVWRGDACLILTKPRWLPERTCSWEIVLESRNVQPKERSRFQAYKRNRQA